MTDDEERTEAEQRIARDLLGVGFFYDFDGQPIGVEEFGRLAMSPDKIVARTEIGPRTVSTVWIGVDHGRMMWARLHPDGPELPPIIYETMVFPDHEISDRYATREQAAQGHEDIVTLLRATEERDTEPPEEPGAPE